MKTNQTEIKKNVDSLKKVTKNIKIWPTHYYYIITNY